MADKYWCCGFELGDNNGNPEMVLSGATIQSSVKRTGTYALKCAPGSGESQYASNPLWPDSALNWYPTPVSHLGQRFYMRVTSLPSVARWILRWKEADDTAYNLVKLNPDGTLSLYNLSGSLVGTSVTALTNTGKDYRVELVIVGSSVGGIWLFVDGVVEASGQTGTYVSLQKFDLGFYDTEASAAEAYFDDVACLFGAGSYPAVPGPGRVVCLPPNGAGTYAQWQSGCVYTNVDEIPHDGDTTVMSEATGSKNANFATDESAVPAGLDLNGACAIMVAKYSGTRGRVTTLIGQTTGGSRDITTTYGLYAGWYAQGLVTKGNLASALVGAECWVWLPTTLKCTQVMLIVDYEEEAPDPPSGLKPTGTVLVREPTFSGDYEQGGAVGIAGAQVEVRTTEDVLVWDSGDVSWTVDDHWLVGYGGTPLSAGQSYKWRARNKSLDAVWGSWSGYQNITIDGLPTTPTGCDPSGGASVTDTTPDLSWTHNDPDSQAQRFWQMELKRNDTGVDVSGYPQTADGSIDRFSVSGAFGDDESLPSGETWSTRGTWSKSGVGLAYCTALSVSKGIAVVGSGLADGKVRALVKCELNNGLVFRASDIVAGTEDYWLLRFIAGSVYGKRLRLSRYDGSSTEVPVATTSDLDLAADEDYWLMVVLDGDSIECYLNGVNLAELSTTNSENQAATSHGLYVEAVDGGSQDQFDNWLCQASDGESSTHTVETTLSQPVTYKWRVRTHDGQGWGPWSDWNIFVCLVGVTVTIDSPTRAEVVTAPPASCSWTMSGGTAPQSQYRVYLYAADGVEVLEDSGWVASGDEEHDFTYTDWANNTTYKLKVLCRDSTTPTPLGGSSSIRTFSTSWAPPATVTGVSVTAVTAEGEWTSPSAVYDKCYESEGGEASNFIDGDIATWWGPAHSPCFHWIVVDLGSTKSVLQARLYQAAAGIYRFGGNHGLKVYVSDSPTSFGDPVWEGVLSALGWRYSDAFSASGRYVKVESKYAENSFQRGLELEVLVGPVVACLPHMELRWDESSETDFTRYEVWRRKTGETAYMRIATITDQATVWHADYRAGLKDAWEYIVKQVVPVGVDEVPSDPSTMVSAAFGVKDKAYLHDLTDEGNVYIELQLAPDKSFRHVLDRDVVLPMGATKPVEHLGKGDWWEFSISATWLMEDEGSRATLAKLLSDGNPLCYRDGRGRRYFCRPAETDEADEQPAQFRETIPFTEIDFCESV